MSRGHFSNKAPAALPREAKREPSSKVAQRSIDRVGFALEQVFAAARTQDRAG